MLLLGLRTLTFDYDPLNTACIMTCGLTPCLYSQREWSRSLEYYTYSSRAKLFQIDVQVLEISKLFCYLNVGHPGKVVLLEQEKLF